MSKAPRDLSPARIKRIRIVRESIEKVVKILSGKKIRVVQRGSQAAVQYDTRTLEPVCVIIPIIPDDASDDLIDAVQGFIDHEVAHLLYTDHLVGVDATHMGPRYHFFWNALEDCFIERRVVKDFVGSALNLSRTRNLFAERFIKPKYEELLKDPNSKPVDFWNQLSVCALRAWSGQQELKDFMDEGNKWRHIEDVTKALAPHLPAIASPVNSRECLELAVKLCNIVYGKPQPEQEQNQNDDQEGDQSNQSGQGQGSGGKGQQVEAEFEEDPDETPDEPESDEAGDESEGDASEDEGDGSESDESEGDETEDGDGADGEDQEGEDADESGKPDESEGQEEGEEEAPSFGEESADEQEEGEDAADKGEEGDDAEGKQAGAEADADKSDGDEDMAEGNDTPQGLDPDSLGQNAPSPFEEADFDPKQVDFDTATQNLVSQLAQQSHASSNYVPYSTEYDRIERFAPRVTQGSQVQEIDRVYREMEESLKNMVGTLQRSLERAFVAMNRERWETAQLRGKLNPGALSRLLAEDDRVFRRREEVKTKAVDVSLVVDCSGSMCGREIYTAMQTGWALAETLDRLHIPCEVLGFTTAGAPQELVNAFNKNKGNYHRFDPLYIPIFKEFNERFGVEQKRRMVMATMGYLNMCGNTDGESIRYAADRLLRQNNPGKAMMVLSDGMPSAGELQPLISHLKQTTAAIEKQGVNLVGIGICTDAPKQFYRKSVTLNSIDQLATTVIGQLRDALLQR